MAIAAGAGHVDQLVRHTPLIYQHERSECGLACLAMVAGHYVRGVDLIDVRRVAGHGQRGHSLQQLLQLAEQMGFTARGVKLEPEQLPQLRQPSILHWDLNHFVVLIKATRRRVVVHDPAAGRRVYTWAQLAQHFTGVALELWPGADELVQPGQARLSLGEVWRMARGGAQSLGLVVVLSVLLQVLLLTGPWHLQWTIDAAIASGDVNLVTVLAVGFAVLLVLRTLVTWLRALVVINLGYGLSFVFAARLLRHLLHLPLTWFGQRSVGDIAARFASLQPLRDFFTQGAASLLVDAVIVLLSLAAMLLYAPLLGLLVLAVQTVYVVIYGLCIGRMKQHSLAAVVAQGKEHAHLVESIRAVHSIKVYGQQGQRYAAWQKLYGATLSASRQVQVMQAALLTLATACSGAELIAVITLAAQQILAGEGFSVGMLVALLSYRGYFTERLRSCVDLLAQVHLLRVHLQRLADIWLESPEVDSVGVASSAHTATAPQAMTLRGVGFRYGPQATYLFRDVNLAIAPGEFVAIVGVSGAGKSTLLRLLMGLLAPVEGEIRIGSQCLQAHNAHDFRARCACVLQEDTFFSGSLADNICLFEPVDTARLDAVLQQVGLQQDVASLPMGARSAIGDIGSQFSSGQMQRLWLARALYRQPDYLFLDEGTANLDADSTAAIAQQVASLTCTRIAITHNMALAARADRVLLLQNGQLAEIDLSQQQVSAG